MNPAPLLRSMLFVPGNDRRRLESAARTTADALILDLEDSVRPDDQKPVARAAIRAALDEGLFAGRTLFVRVNDAESGHLPDDVNALAVPGIAGFVLPKCRTAAEVESFHGRLAAVEAERGFPAGAFSVVLLIETPAAVLHTEDLCRASSRVIAAAFGCEDFLADLGSPLDDAGPSLPAARSLIVLGARAAGVQAIDTIHVRVHDLAELERDLASSRQLGFDGMLLLHPNEIEPAHRHLSPSPAEVEHARAVLRLSEEAADRGRGVALLDGRIIGPPVVRAARRTLARHEAIQAARRPS